MLTEIYPKLPMRNAEATKAYYLQQLDFVEIADYGDYLIIKKDKVEIHFFEFKELDPKENYGQVYINVENIDGLYQWLLDRKVAIHPNGHLANKPWGQREFALLDPNHNLLTFGCSI